MPRDRSRSIIATLSINLSYTPAAGDQYTLINNTSGLAINGSFDGLGEGSPLTINGNPFKITYKGGTTGHNVVITALTPSYFYAEAAWASEYTNGQTIPDADPVKAGNQPAVYGTTAFSSVNSAITAAATAAASSGNPATVIVNAGTYNENVAIHVGDLQIVLQQGPITFESLTSTFSNSPIAILNSGSLTVGTAVNTASYTVASPISGTGGLADLGGGTLTLTSGNSYSGATSVMNGKLQAGDAGAFSEYSDYTISSGADLQLDGYNNIIGSLAGSGIVENNSATPATLTSGDTLNASFTGTIRNGAAGGALIYTQEGTGIFTLSGTETFSGGINFNGGTVSAASLASLGTGPWSFTGGTLAYSGEAHKQMWQSLCNQLVLSNSPARGVLRLRYPVPSPDPAVSRKAAMIIYC